MSCLLPGTSRHFSHKRDWFIDFSPFNDSVVFDGGEEYTVVGRGTVQIQFGGPTLIFLNVYYVPSMEINLLSVNQIMRNSPQLYVVFSVHKCSTIDKETSLTIVVGLEDHGLYKLLGTGDSPEVALTVRVSSISTLWHQRYGHLNMQYLSQLSREGLVSGLADIQTQQLGVCGACQAGKQHRSSFKDGESWRTSKCSEDQPHSVLLLVGPPNGRDDAALVFDDALPELPPENNPPLATPIVPEPSPPPPDIGSSTLRPKWWAKTIGNLWDNELLEGKKPISCKWMYKVKYKADGTLDKYKACLVARGFSQKEGINYEETFAPTTKMSTIWFVLSLVAQFNWKVHQMDVKSAFLNGDLQEEVYMM
eukprot:PITA_32077